MHMDIGIIIFAVQQGASVHASCCDILQAQFAMYVFPGETLQTEMWHEGQKVIFQTRVLERDVLAITKAAVELTHAAPARL